MPEFKGTLGYRFDSHPGQSYVLWEPYTDLILKHIYFCNKPIFNPQICLFCDWVWWVMLEEALSTLLYSIPRGRDPLVQGRYLEMRGNMRKLVLFACSLCWHGYRLVCRLFETPCVCIRAYLPCTIVMRS